MAPELAPEGRWDSWPVTRNWKGFCCGNRASRPLPSRRPPTEVTGETGRDAGRTCLPACGFSVMLRLPKVSTTWEKVNSPYALHSTEKSPKTRSSLPRSRELACSDRCERRTGYEAPRAHTPRPHPVPAATAPKVILVTERYQENCTGNAMSVIVENHLLGPTDFDKI